MTLPALLALVAFVAGTVDAVAGGGGLITLPALIAAGLPDHIALATNKGQSVWGSGASLAAFARAGRIDAGQAALTFPLALAGAVAGAELQLWLTPDTLRPVVIAMLVLATVLMAVRRPARDGDGPRRLPIAAALALGLGAYDGFFGPGVGTFLIVGFVTLCGRSLVSATANAKVVNFASNLASLAAFAYAGNVRWDLALPMAVGQLAGGVVGARLAMAGGARLVRLAVLAVSAALIARLVYQLVTA